MGTLSKKVGCIKTDKGILEGIADFKGKIMDKEVVSVMAIKMIIKDIQITNHFILGEILAKVMEITNKGIIFTDIKEVHLEGIEATHPRVPMATMLEEGIFHQDMRIMTKEGKKVSQQVELDGQMLEQTLTIHNLCNLGHCQFLATLHKPEHCPRNLQGNKNFRQ